MVSGYCKCGFPASLSCPKCKVKLCGNCYPIHVKLCEDIPKNVPLGTPPPVAEYKRKPGRPPVRK